MLVRSEVFDRLKDEINADHAELRVMLARSSSDNGWDEPGMEAYDTYQAKP